MTHDAARDFLASRRSYPLRLLSGPGPDRAGIEALLTIAARVPDHGKLEPWRFVVLAPAALRRIAGLITARGTADGREPEAVEKAAAAFRTSPLAVVVVGCPKSVERIPAIEQQLSAGAVCLSLVNAALASGWGAVWLTGWPAHDRATAAATFGIEGAEWVAGIVHIGTPTEAPPPRPRPDVAALTRWIDA
jgi:nitroreductase